MADYYIVTTTVPNNPTQNWKANIYLKDEPLVVAVGDVIDVPAGCLIFLDTSQIYGVLSVGVTS